MNIFKKVGLSLVTFVLSNIPIYIFLLVKHFLSPNGFWQKLILFGFGVWALGGIQIIFWIFAVVFIYYILKEEK